MNKEVKEIIDYIDDRIIPNEKWEKIKEHITDLEKDNKRLTKQLEKEKNKNKKAFKILDEALTNQMIKGEATINLVELCAILK